MANKLIVNQMPSVLDLSVIKDVNGNPITLRPRDQHGSKREVTADVVMHEVVQRVLEQRWIRLEPVAKEVDVLEAPLVSEPKRNTAPRAAEPPPSLPPADEPPAPSAEEPPPVTEEQPVPVVEEPPAEPPVPEEPPALPAEEAPAEPPLVEEPPAEPPPAIEPEAGSSAKTTAKLRRDRR